MKGQKMCSKCGHESIEVQLKSIKTQDEIPDNCSFCGTEGEPEDALYEDENIMMRTVIYKCKKCENLEGFTYTLQEEYYHDYDEVYDPFFVKIAEQEGSPIHSASKCMEFGKRLKKKERNPIEKCKKRLILLIREKYPLLKSAGVGSKTIDNAKWKAQCFIERKGHCTEKQLRSIFSAEICLAQEAMIRQRKILKKEITERQLKTIFEIDRKTIRNWKRKLKEKQGTLKIGIKTHQSDEQSEYSVIEIPKEIKSINRLEKPYKEQCDFCEKNKLLSVQIHYTNGSWSTMCEQSYEKLKDYSLEEE